MLGFAQSDPKWGVDALLGSLRSIRFDIGGFRRSWWDFYLAAGLTVGIFYVFAAILAWRLASVPTEALARMRGVTWAFALAFAGVAAVSWIYLFLIPILFSTLITLCLIAAAWLSSR